MTEQKQDSSVVGKIQPFLLVENDLFWERPLKEGYMRLMRLPDAMKLIEIYGISTIKERAGQYEVFANAVSYLADVRRVIGNAIYDASLLPPAEREVVYLGDLTIYKHGQIDGERVSGPERVGSGMIWKGRKTSEKQFYGDKGLYEIIFSDITIEEKKIGRIESILAGYEQAESERQSNQIRRDHSNWKSGRISGIDGY